MTASALVTCPACGGTGEIWECVNDGKAGCSHINDYTYRCQDCDGDGQVPADEPLPYWRPDTATGTGITSRHDWPVSLVFALLIFGSLIFLALVTQGQRAMCATHHDQLRYCAHYDQETNSR